MIVVVDGPGCDACWALVLPVVGLGVQDFYGHDALLALGFAVVLGLEWLRSAMLGGRADDAREDLRAATGPVVGVQAVDVGDAVGGEEHRGSGQER
ncbi:hypothetical protein RIF23_03085 [Lipingzhangella sp. LS1_29]|uniref:Uncharacterized protein n=1 Tax=Lipingzhangella rawalii TaxID=2055835 RepID=A0ABU2H1U6_9ACTN|nr:hypothetical protein [Lipingzhangella rawalii]MDS1269277.1 hypothetical protein [Lipingzhangella rawalii]